MRPRQHEEGPRLPLSPAQLKTLLPGPPKPLEAAPRPPGNLRVHGRKGIAEDRHHRCAGEEADYLQRNLSDVVQLVGCRGGHHRHLLLRETSPLVSYDRLGLTFEDEQDLLGAVRVPSDVLFRLKLEVDGRGACRPGLCIDGEIVLIPANRRLSKDYERLVQTSEMLSRWP
jgi:hypothetical protein